MAEDHDREGPFARPGAAGLSSQIDTTEGQYNSANQQRLNQSYQTSNTQRAGPDANRPNHPTLHSSIPRNRPSELPPQPPQFSLAGSVGPQSHASSYVDPRYYEYNPSYRNPKLAPVWGLAKPLPRVVRPGMRRGGRATREKDGVVEDTNAGIDAPGTAEAIPQLGMIDEQRQEEGKEPMDKQTTDEEHRGYGHQQRQTRGKQQRRGTENTVGRQGSVNSVLDRYGTPNDERSNPLEEWKSRASQPPSDLFDSNKGDLGERQRTQLSNLSEVPNSRSILNSSHQVEGNDQETGTEVGDWGLENEEAEQYMEEEEDMHNSWASIRARLREPLAECLGTMIAILIGLATNLSVQTSNDTRGTYFSANWAWGLGITIGIYIAGGISGAHLNPAISLTLCLYRGFPLRKAGIYISAQLLGALIAGLLAYGVYRDAIIDFNSTGGRTGAKGGSTNSVGLYAGGTGISFYTQPAEFAGAGGAFANEFLATAILSCAILALGDDSNAPPGAGMHAFIVGLLVTALTMAFGYNTGACLNPARDFGPRLATAIVGYGGSVFTARDAWWIYGAWGATISGALAGGAIYDVAIFVGGESPINYPRGKRRKVRREAKEGAKRKWWMFKRDVEMGIKGEFGKETKAG